MMLCFLWNCWKSIFHRTPDDPVFIENILQNFIGSVAVRKIKSAQIQSKDAHLSYCNGDFVLIIHLYDNIMLIIQYRRGLDWDVICVLLLNPDQHKNHLFILITNMWFM